MLKFQERKTKKKPKERDKWDFEIQQLKDTGKIKTKTVCRIEISAKPMKSKITLKDLLCSHSRYNLALRTTVGKEIVTIGFFLAEKYLMKL